MVYPGNAPRRAGEEEKIREEIEALAQEMGLGGLEVVSFAEEYQQSFFVGGKGLHLMLVAALVSACSLAALLVVLQKDAASLRRRRREFALLQTIGMTRRRVLKMLILEHFLYALAGLGFGIPVSLFILTGLYSDGGAPQMTSPMDVPWDPGGRPGGDDGVRSDPASSLPAAGDEEPGSGGDYTEGGIDDDRTSKKENRAGGKA